LGFVFEDGFGFERYRDYMLDVPMYFLRRDGKYNDASGLSFRDFLDGRLSIAPGVRPHILDWEDHLSTAFPEVRLKRFLEMRGADSGPWGRICALPALWVGILYDADALAAAWDIAKGWSAEQREQLREDAARFGLKAKIAGRTVQEIGLEMIAISREGLRRRARAGALVHDETNFLDALQRTAESGVTLGEEMAEKFVNEFGGDARKLLAEISF
jgi:glutamate--cysteine ligase